MKRIIATIAIALATIAPAHAFKKCPDDWKFRQDKQEHFAGSTVMAATFNAVTDDPWKAFGASIAIGGVYEIYQGVTGSGCPSFYDFGYDVLGSAIGAYVGYQIKGLIISPNHIAYTKSF